MTAIRRAGGTAAVFDDSLIGRLKLLVQGEKPLGVSVLMSGERITSQFLQRHEDFRELEIDFLMLERTALTESDIERLIRTHPLRSLDAEGAAVSSDAIAALGLKEGLSRVAVPNTALTDHDLSLLPLESLDELEIDHTQVSPQGLRMLDRCRKLSVLSLDGSQFSSEIADTLQALQVERLILRGSDVVDEHLLRLRGLTTLWEVQLDNTSVSPEAIKDLRAASPDCLILDM